MRYGRILNVLACLLVFVICACVQQQTVDLAEVKKTKKKFVGSESCRACHADQYAAWQKTAHSRLAVNLKENPDAFVVDYNPETIRADLKKLEEAGKLKVALNDLFIPEKSELRYAIGADWKQRYVIEKDGVLYLAPIQYFIKSGNWAGYNEDSWEKRPWMQKCGGCHVTGVEYNFESPGNSTFNEPGIGCEACHGAGSWHASLPKTAILEKQDTIVNPAKLPTGLAVQVCGSCHVRGSSTKAKGASFPVGYEPGKVLNEYFDMTSFAGGQENRHYPNEQAKSHHQQYQDWLLSKHFDEGVGCTACHYVHDNAEDQNNYQTKKTSGSRTCFACHVMVNTQLAHSIHSFGNCIGCHMPRIAKSTDHNDIHSHSFIPLTPEETIKDPKNPNSCQGCHRHKNADINELNNKFKAFEVLPTPTAQQSKTR